jgi:hypothetical protein
LLRRLHKSRVFAPRNEEFELLRRVQPAFGVTGLQTAQALPSPFRRKIAGRNRARKSPGGRTTQSAVRSVRWIAKLFGASSPSTMRYLDQGEGDRDGDGV